MRSEITITRNKSMDLTIGSASATMKAGSDLNLDLFVGVWGSAPTDETIVSFTVGESDLPLQKVFDIPLNATLIALYQKTVNGRNYSDMLFYSASAETKSTDFQTRNRVDYIENRSSTYSKGTVCVTSRTSLTPVTSYKLKVVFASCGVENITWYIDTPQFVEKKSSARNNAIISSSGIDESTLVHIAETETITGEKTFTDHLLVTDGNGHYFKAYYTNSTTNHFVLSNNPGDISGTSIHFQDGKIWFHYGGSPVSCMSAGSLASYDSIYASSYVVPTGGAIYDYFSNYYTKEDVDNMFDGLGDRRVAYDGLITADTTYNLTSESINTYSMVGVRGNSNGATINIASDSNYNSILFNVHFEYNKVYYLKFQYKNSYIYIENGGLYYAYWEDDTLYMHQLSQQKPLDAVLTIDLSSSDIPTSDYYNNSTYQVYKQIKFTNSTSASSSKRNIRPNFRVESAPYCVSIENADTTDITITPMVSFRTNGRTSISTNVDTFTIEANTTSRLLITEMGIIKL